LSSTSSVAPRRGEIWLVDLDPTIGAEIQKTRPVDVVSSDSIGRLPLRLVAPMTGWKDQFASNLWHVRIEPIAANGLIKVSAVDALQVRGVSVERFRQRLGRLSATLMEEIAAAIAAIVEYS
jgi:mRNA interferase MazF